MPVVQKFASLILDIDGTVWNTTDVVSVAWNNAIVRAGYGIAPVKGEDLRKEFGKPMDIIADDLWPSLSSSQKESLMALCCEEEQKALLSNTRDLTYPGVVDAVKALSSKVPVFVVSNCQAGYIELTLSKTGLGSYVKDFECFGNTGKGKSDNIRLLMERNSLKAPVYVGDTQGDCDACVAVPIPFIWASYGFGTADSYIAKIDSFLQLKEFF